MSIRTTSFQEYFVQYYIYVYEFLLKKNKVTHDLAGNSRACCPCSELAYRYHPCLFEETGKGTFSDLGKHQRPIIADKLQKPTLDILLHKFQNRI